MIERQLEKSKDNPSLLLGHVLPFVDVDERCNLFVTFVLLYILYKLILKKTFILVRFYTSARFYACQ